MVGAKTNVKHKAVPAFIWEEVLTPGLSFKTINQMTPLTEAKLQVMIEELIEHREYLLDCFLVSQAEKLTNLINELIELKQNNSYESIQ